MKYKELENKSINDLYEMLHAYKKESFNLRVQKGLGELVENPIRSRFLRKAMAKIQTKLSAIKISTLKKNTHRSL